MEIITDDPQRCIKWLDIDGLDAPDPDRLISAVLTSSRGRRERGQPHRPFAGVPFLMGPEYLVLTGC